MPLPRGFHGQPHTITEAQAWFVLMIQGNATNKSLYHEPPAEGPGGGRPPRGYRRRRRRGAREEGGGEGGGVPLPQKVILDR